MQLCMFDIAADSVIMRRGAEVWAQQKVLVAGPILDSYSTAGCLFELCALMYVV